MRGRPARRLALVVGFTAIASAGLYTGACSPGDPAGSVVGPGALDGVIYEGGATDEGLTALLAAEIVQEPTQAAVLDEPLDGADLPGRPAPVFRWHIGGAAGDLGAPAPEGSMHRAARGWAALWELLGPAREARAHGAPMNGRGYFLVLSAPGSETLVRVFTMALSYTPDEAALERLAAASGPVTAVITNAVFEDNRVTPGGGPFAGEPITFTVQR